MSGPLTFNLYYAVFGGRESAYRLIMERVHVMSARTINTNRKLACSVTMATCQW